MRDCSTNRAGFDRVLMAVAATFLAVSATSALAGVSDTPRAGAAELAIDAAVPRPEPANVPPPTASDFKMDAATSAPAASIPAASVPAAAKAAEPSTAKAVEIETRTDTKPAEMVTAPAADTKANDTAKTNDTATTTTTTPPATAAAPAAEPAKEPVKAASNVPPADQPVADKLRDMLGAKSVRYFDRKVRGDVPRRIALRKCRGRGHREEGCRDGHQHAVKSSTAIAIVTHRHTPWVKLPRHGTALKSSPSQLC